MHELPAAACLHRSRKWLLSSSLPPLSACKSFLIRFNWSLRVPATCYGPTDLRTWLERPVDKLQLQVVRYLHLLHVRTWIMNTSTVYMHPSPSWFRYEPNAYMYVYPVSLRALTLTWLVGPLYSCILHFTPGSDKKKMKEKKRRLRGLHACMQLDHQSRMKEFAKICVKQSQHAVTARVVSNCMPMPRGPHARTWDWLRGPPLGHVGGHASCMCYSHQCHAWPINTTMVRVEPATKLYTIFFSRMYGTQFLYWYEASTTIFTHTNFVWNRNKDRIIPARAKKWRIKWMCF